MTVVLHRADGTRITVTIDAQEIPDVVYRGPEVFVHEAGSGHARAVAGEIRPSYREATRLYRVGKGDAT